MSTAISWQETNGYFYSDELSDTLRTALQPKVKFRQFCDPDEGALNKGLHRGEKYFWNNYGDLSRQGRRLSELDPIPEASFTVGQDSLTIVEFGQSVPYTGKLTALAKHDVQQLIRKGLVNDARKCFDIEAYLQFDATKLRAAPTGGTSTTAITLTENGSTVTTNNVALGTGHVKAIVDVMRTREIPGYTDDDYVAITTPVTLRPFKNDLETIHQYTREGQSIIYNGETGRYEGCRFCEQTFIPEGGAIDSTTFDPYTKTADAWNNAKSSWCFFFGGDTVQEAIVVPEEIRAKLPQDYGRSGGIAWYAMEGFGLTHTGAAQSRIVKWDSAA